MRCHPALEAAKLFSKDFNESMKTYDHAARYDYMRLIGLGSEKGRGSEKAICSEKVYFAFTEFIGNERLKIGNNIETMRGVEYDIRIDPQDLYVPRDKWDENIRDIYPHYLERLTIK